MPKLPLLTLAAAALLALSPAAAGPTNAHFDPTKFPKACTPCHQGHGMPGTSMLKHRSGEFCVTCHEPAAKDPGRRATLGLGAAANAQDIRSELSKPANHGRTSCFDCHSSHGAARAPVVGFQNLSQKRTFLLETDLCLSCHGSRGARGADSRDLSKLFLATNPSFHPLLAAGRATSVPSLLSQYTASSLMNCTDCHTNDDRSGPRGPHGSRVLKLLGNAYALADGQVESPAAYALCYGCHGRASILSDASFTEHKKHVAEEKTSCATCHNPHGATSARALIRFNEPAPGTGVTPSSSGRLEFISSTPGRGTCYLTCHGKNHDPLTYGGGALGMERPRAVPAALRGDTHPALPQAGPAPGRPEPRKLPEPKR